MVKLSLRHTRKFLRYGFLGSLILVAAGCSTDSHRALFPIELRARASGDSNWVQQRDDLEKLLKADPSLRAYVEDLVTATQAEVAEEGQEWEKASQLWLATLKLDKGTVGKVAFQR